MAWAATARTLYPEPGTSQAQYFVAVVNLRRRGGPLPGNPFALKSDFSEMRAKNALLAVQPP